MQSKNDTPENKAREKIDAFLKETGWDIVSREEFTPDYPSAVREALMGGNKESDYLFFIDGKAIAVLEAKREENILGTNVEEQAENYARIPKSWYGLWFTGLIPLVYMSNGKKILFKNLLSEDTEYTELDKMHSPKEMLKIIGKKSEYGAIPKLNKYGLRDCQYRAELKLEEHLRQGKKRNLAVLATGSGKTYLACLASYRLLNYSSVRRVLFLADRNNLAVQAEKDFNNFDLTEKSNQLNSIYNIRRLKNESDINNDIIISTIQKLYAIMTGQKLTEENEDAEDERNSEAEENSGNETVQLDGNVKISRDHFDLIIVDECHRSIYGRWKAVLNYFSDAIIMGLTATQNGQAEAYFNQNYIENYTYEDSVIDDVNVPVRIYRIVTDITEHGGSIKAGSTVNEITKNTGEYSEYKADTQSEYGATDLDRSVINRDQIRRVLISYKDSIYTDLYPERKAMWEYIPKTLIFAKNDKHADEIIQAVKKVFSECFESGIVPEHFVQKITYSAGDSNTLIRDMINERDFRIAITVSLVATGTNIKPLEVVLFMRDVQSDIFYTQMKGRACRKIIDDMLREVTPNADTKECFYIVDAVGVTEHEKLIPKIALSGNGLKKLTLFEILERLSHNDLSDDNLMLLRDYCTTINNRYENNSLFGYHLTEFTNTFGFSPLDLSNTIRYALEKDELPPFISPSEDNSIRSQLIAKLIGNVPARKKLLELQKGYVVITEEDPDKLISAGFTVETSRSYIENFQKFITEHKDDIEALRIIYNSEDMLITKTMLHELRDKLLSEDRHFSILQMWKCYRTIDPVSVDELDEKSNAKLLTNLIQIIRYAYGKSQKLTTLINGFAQRFSLYCGQVQRSLSADQTEVMRQIAEYIIGEGAITAIELNEIETDLWRRGVKSFGSVAALNDEMNSLSKIILKVA